MKIIQTKKIKKLRNCLCFMQNGELNHIVLEKGFFTSIKGHPCALELSTRIGEGRILHNWKLFLTI